MLSTSLRLATAALAATGVLGTAVPALVVTHHEQVTRSRAEAVLGRMSLAQEVGQLFMVGTPAGDPSPITKRQIRRFHLGNVILTGRSHAGSRATAHTVATLQRRTTRAATHGVDLLVATDQEGGAVQVLHGRGFAEIPSALHQGRWRPARLRRAATHWAHQLHRAGVNMDLAPVADTVPGPPAARHNPPIGAYEREFGHRPRKVGHHARAFVLGMSEGGVLPTVKHFPGLGRVHANTDTSAGVTDRRTRRHDPYLAPFRAAVDAGVPFVMVSTAFYPRIDRRRPAAFSHHLISDVLRGDLGFRGVVVSDDLANARQVARWSPGRRAVRFLAAGGDLVLAVNPATLPAMYHAVLDRARRHPGFRATVERAALRVLRVKAQADLLGR